MKEEILVVKKEHDKLKVKVCDRSMKRWKTGYKNDLDSSSKYEKVIANRDYNLLAYLFYDLDNLGYNVRKAFARFVELQGDPELFFLK
jgi:hypothetical protein